MPSAKEVFFVLDEALNAGRLDEARSHRENLYAQGKDAIALTLLGRISAAEGDIVGGLAFMGEAIRLEPYYEPAYRYRAEMFHAIGHTDRVVEDMEALLLYYPIKQDLIANYADLSMRIGRLDHAAHMLERAVRRDANNAFFLNLSGLVLQASNRKEEAADFYERAIARDPNSPHFHNNLGTALHALDRFHASQVALEKAIAIDPRFEMAWYNLGNVFKDGRQFAEAEHCYRQAIALRPDYPDARLNLGCILIQQNRWDEGWKQYEYRWRVPNLMAQPSASLPRWQGESLSGKHIMISAEQGIGDTLQFVRYLPQLAARGARVTFVCPPNVSPLLSRFHPDIKVTSTPQLSQYGGYWAPLMSLPPLLGASPTEIPPAPYLEVEADRVAYFTEKLGKRKTAKQLRVGIVWGGNPNQQDDHHRSIPLDQLQTLFAMPNVRFISLQKGGHLDELQHTETPIEDWSAELDDYDDTGALMQAIDGVLSICSSPLHLAGALGIRTLGLMGWAADWRWGLSGSETPWYPTVKLLRQAEFGNWESIARDAVAELKTWKPIAPSKTTALTDLDPGLRPAATIRAKTHYGIVDLLRDDPYVTASISAIGEYCQDEINLLGKYSPTKAVVVESGANVGAHTLPFAHFVGPQGRVIAFEGSSEMFRLLARNVDRAELTHVEVHHAQLDAAKGTTTIAVRDYRTAEDIDVLSIPEEEALETVATVTLDSLKLKSLNLLKINHESSALNLLEGARETIARCKPVIYLQELPVVQPEKLRKVLKTAGYRLYRYRNSLTALGLSNNALQRTQSDLGVSCLAIPKDAPQPTDLSEYSS